MLRSSTRATLRAKLEHPPHHPKRLAVLLATSTEGMHALSSTEAIRGRSPCPLGPFRARTRRSSQPRINAGASATNSLRAIVIDRTNESFDHGRKESPWPDIFVVMGQRESSSGSWRIPRGGRGDPEWVRGRIRGTVDREEDAI